jgi:translation initiation factor IF-3
LMFRGREMAHTDIGEKVVEEFIKSLDGEGTVESPSKRFGRTITLVLAPSVKKKKVQENNSAQTKDT